MHCEHQRIVYSKTIDLPLPTHTHSPNYLLPGERGNSHLRSDVCIGERERSFVDHVCCSTYKHATPPTAFNLNYVPYLVTYMEGPEFSSITVGRDAIGKCTRPD